MQLRVILLSCFVADDYCWHIRASRYIVIITSWWRFQTCDHVVACEHESKCCTCDDFKSVTWCYYSLGCNLRLRRVIQYLILFYTRVIEEHNKKRRPHRQPYKWTKSDLLDTTEFKQTKLMSAISGECGCWEAEKVRSSLLRLQASEIHQPMRREGPDNQEETWKKPRQTSTTCTVLKSGAMTIMMVLKKKMGLVPISVHKVIFLQYIYTN